MHLNPTWFLPPALAPLVGAEPPPAGAWLPAPMDPASLLEWPSLDLGTLGWALAALLLSGLFAALRRSVGHATAERVLARVAEDPVRRERLAPLLERLGPLSTSASVLEMSFALLFGVLVLQLVAEGQVLAWPSVLGSLALSVPTLWFVDVALASALALRAGDRIVISGLPAFYVLQMPIAALAWLFEAVRRGVLRLLGLKDDTESTRQVMEGLRDVISEAEIEGRNLTETERQIIGNVMEFRDVDVAAIMTPRTEIDAVSDSEGLDGVARSAAAFGHSRIPVYEGTLDTIVGTVSARDLVQAMAAPLDGAAVAAGEDLSSIVRPAYFVPETKQVSELMAEMRREKIKMAIVLDEYGGTAGIVTMGDILEEIVGEMPDEYDEDEPSPVRQLPGGVAEVEAHLHVTEVNEVLNLDIPEEEDFETLGGFVLAELGHFPKRGESFLRDGTEFAVSEANDRRVLKVRVTRPVAS